MIPPTALELLHNKDGGHCFFVSHCMDNQSDFESRSEDDKPCAYHICLKLCCWLGEEHFLYARHDFHTGNNLLLVTGLNGEQVTRKMKAQFGGQPQPHLLLIILALTTTWLQHIRSVGWNLDCATQRLESETGFANLNFQAIRPLPPDKLSLRRELAAVRASLHAAARASRQMGERLKFLTSQVSAYHNAQSQASAIGADSPLTRLDHQLIQACEHQKAEQTAQHEQLQGLIRRLDVQWDVVTALRADHNGRLTMEMARDSRNDSVLMRRIAFVTIIFLPATFMATFFSMSFFRVSDGRLTVSSWIWLYAVCTVPLTLVLGIGYSDIPERWRRFRGRLANLNRKEE